VGRFTEKLARFTGKVLVITSGNDLTAAEFTDATRSNRKLRHLMKGKNIIHKTLPNVDHTFSRGVWRGGVEALSSDFVKKIKAIESN
jgi:hypothetical protein